MFYPSVYLELFHPCSFVTSFLRSPFITGGRQFFLKFFPFLHNTRTHTYVFLQCNFLPTRFPNFSPFLFQRKTQSSPLHFFDFGLFFTRVRRLKIPHKRNPREGVPVFYSGQNFRESRERLSSTVLLKTATTEILDTISLRLQQETDKSGKTYLAILRRQYLQASHISLPSSTTLNIHFAT